MSNLYKHRDTSMLKWMTNTQAKCELSSFTLLSMLFFIVPEEECEEDFEDDVPVGEPEMGVLQMLRQHREDGDDYYGYDEEDY